MSSGYLGQGQESVLLFIDDADMLIMANLLLAGGTRRLLMSRCEASALWILRHIRVDTAIIRESADKLKRVQLCCLERGITVHLMNGVVEEEIVHFSLPLSPAIAGGLTAPATR